MTHLLVRQPLHWGHVMPRFSAKTNHHGRGTAKQTDSLTRKDVGGGVAWLLGHLLNLSCSHPNVA